MTIIDAFLQFDSAFNGAQVVGTYNSTNVIDLHGPAASMIPVLVSGQGARDIGTGDDPAMKLVSYITTTFTSGGAGTFQLKMQGAPDNGSGSPGTYYDMWTSAAVALANLIAGQNMANIDMPRVPPGQVLPRFLRVQYIIGGATMTAGVVQTELVLDEIDHPQSTTGVLSGYPAGIAIAN